MGRPIIMPAIEEYTGVEGETSAEPVSRVLKRSPRHVLEFEKPIARLEAQIHELEATESQNRVDYSKELRQLRTNYTSLLRKTYENLSAWETVQVARHPHRPLRALPRRPAHWRGENRLQQSLTTRT